MEMCKPLIGLIIHSIDKVKRFKLSKDVSMAWYTTFTIIKYLSTCSSDLSRSCKSVNFSVELIIIKCDSCAYVHITATVE